MKHLFYRFYRVEGITEPFLEGINMFGKVVHIIILSKVEGYINIIGNIWWKQ